MIKLEDYWDIYEEDWFKYIKIDKKDFFINLKPKIYRGNITWISKTDYKLKPNEIWTYNWIHIILK